MGKAQYGILRFAKYKGPEIGHIEAHNERAKEQYTKLTEAENAGREKIQNRLEQAALKKEVAELRATVEKIPPEIMQAYREYGHEKKEEKQNYESK